MRPQVQVVRIEHIWVNPHPTLHQLCHLAINLFNEANFLIRQTGFAMGAQNFVNIPYSKVVQQMESKAEEQGITVIKQKECHSSKCSFLNNEPIEHHDKYKGKKTNKGLFKSKVAVLSLLMSMGTIIS